MLTELRNRGIADALIVCCDGLKGLPEAIRATRPQATVQTCLAHLVRNSLRYASKKYWGQIAKSLREIYTAPTVEAADAHFQEFAEEWRPFYPAMIASWENAWDLQFVREQIGAPITLVGAVPGREQVVWADAGRATLLASAVTSAAEDAKPE